MSWTCPHCHADYNTPRERCEADGWKLVENLRGHTIGERYFLEKLIGVGGMRSTIWRAQQRPTDRSVAVKILPAANPEEAQRFERGARIASNLNHPHITTVHDYGTAPGGMFYLVMELLEGNTLQHMLRQGTIGLLDTIVMADQMLRALEHAHAMSVVHRDLKPSNLFVTKKNDDISFIKIMDFGLAKLATTGTESASDEDDAVSVDPMEDTPALTGTGMVEVNDITQARRICGTPEYMAPEQILGAPIDRRTDLYALGVILYRMVAGQLPFRSKVRHELYQQHLSAPPPPFPLTSSAPEPLQRLILKALSKRPADRFADASEMRNALRAANRSMAPDLGQSFTGLFSTDSSMKLHASAINGSFVAPVPQRRRIWPLVALALLGGGGIATAIVLAASNGGGQVAGSAIADDTAASAKPAEAGAVSNGPATDLAVPSAERVGDLAVASAGQLNEARPPEAALVVPTVQPPTPLPVGATDEVPASYGSVSMATRPVGAEVIHEGKTVGTTPLQLVLPSGEHTIELRAAGYAPSIIPVNVVAGRQVKLDLQLQTSSGDAGNNNEYTSTRRRYPRAGPGVASEAATPVSLPTPGVLGRDVAAPAPSEVKVLGRDVNNAKPDVKILGTQVQSPEPKVKVLGR